MPTRAHRSPRTARTSRTLRTAIIPAQATPATPSSLVKAPRGSLITCGHCGSDRVTSIAMTLTDGSPVEFVSCRRCERRSWAQGGRQLGIETVLEKATKHK